MSETKLTLLLICCLSLCACAGGSFAWEDTYTPPQLTPLEKQQEHDFYAEQAKLDALCDLLENEPDPIKAKAIYAQIVIEEHKYNQMSP